MRKPKNYRLQSTTLQMLGELKSMERYQDCTETELIELAISSLYHAVKVQQLTISNRVEDYMI